LHLRRRRSRLSAALAVSLAALAVSLAALAGCAAQHPPTPPPAPAMPAAVAPALPPHGLARMVATGEMRVGTSGGQAPFSMTTRNGDLVGLDIALARILGQSMGLEVRFVTLPFAELLPALEGGDVDLVMSGMTITPARAQRAAFVGPYVTTGKALLTRSKRLAAVQAAHDLDDPKLRFAALEGSTSEDFAERSLPRAKLVLASELEAAVGLLLAGKVDGVLADRETAAIAVLRHPGAGLLESTATFTVEPIGIAVPLDDPRLASLVQTYLDALASRGVLEKARDFWMKDPSWVKDIR